MPIRLHSSEAARNDKQFVKYLMIILRFVSSCLYSQIFVIFHVLRQQFTRTLQHMAAERPQSSASYWTLAGSVQRRIIAISFTVTCERTFKTRRSRHTFSVLQLSLFICARMKNCCAFVNYGAQSAEIIIVIISLEHTYKYRWSFVLFALQNANTKYVQWDNSCRCLFLLLLLFTKAVNWGCLSQTAWACDLHGTKCCFGSQSWLKVSLVWVILVLAISHAV